MCVSAIGVSWYPQASKQASYACLVAGSGCWSRARCVCVYDDDDGPLVGTNHRTKRNEHACWVGMYEWVWMGMDGMRCMAGLVLWICWLKWLKSVGHVFVVFFGWFRETDCYVWLGCVAAGIVWGKNIWLFFFCWLR